MVGMSIRISAYTVRADGTQTKPRTLYEGEGGEPLATGLMPPCLCLKCRGGRHDRSTTDPQARGGKPA